MKKLFSVIIVILCATMLTMPFSAAVDATANYNAYKQLAKKMSKVTSAETKVTRKYIAEYEGMIMGIKSEVNEAQLLNENGKLEMSSHTKEAYYNYMPLDTYYKGGYFYLDDGGSSKYKIRLDEMYVPNLFSDLNWNLKKSEMIDLTVEELNNGGRRLRYKVPNAKLDALISEVMELLGEDMEGVEIKISDAGYTLTVGADGMLESYTLAYSINLSYEGDIIKAEITTKSKIESVNSLQKINFPADLNTYIDYSGYAGLY